MYLPSMSCQRGTGLISSGSRLPRSRSPAVVSALPNVYDRAQLEEFVAASEAADITDAQAALIERLFESNYGLERATAEVAS